MKAIFDDAFCLKSASEKKTELYRNTNDMDYGMN